MHEFPANPNDQDVFQVRPGLFFKYETATNSWIRITGNEIFPLASPINDGLMAATDLRKLNRIRIPPPRSTIKGQNCEGKFVSGHINIYGEDEFVQITGKPLIRNKGIEHNQKFRISLHTAAFDFTLDKAALITELIKRGQLNLVGKKGPKGKKGQKGKPGQILPTGPKGPKGDRGTGPPCETVIVSETLKSEVTPGTNKAIVDVETRTVSSTEKELVLKRAVIGNPNAAPRRANVKCAENSNWLLAVQRPTGESQQLFYVDVTNIINAIFEKFKDETDELKKQYEADVKSWLETMSSLFHEQKAYLCCALTLCEKQDAKETREEPQPISIPNPVTVNIGTTEEPLFSPVPFLPMNLELPNNVNHWQRPEFLIVDVNINAGTIHDAITIELQKGEYVVEMVDCYIDDESKCSIPITLIYQSNGKELAAILEPDTQLPIKHSGGTISAYVAATPTHHGRTVLRFTEKSQYGIE